MPGEIAPGPTALFYSYSHKDESLRDELAKHLTTLKRGGFIREWYDRQIMAGDEWDRQISIHLENAEIILLLISADFLASKYCYDIEAKRALERHAAGTARVIPIVLRPVVWKPTPFATLQALPANARAVTEWPNMDLAFVSICEGMLAMVLAWKDTAGHIGLAAEEEPDRLKSSGLVRASKRVLDAALPRRVQTGKATTLVVMLRREGSSGLRAIVEVEKDYGVGKEDVRSTPSFRLGFPVGPDGKAAPLDLDLEIHAPDFEPQVQTKSISIPPRGDSEPKVFLLTPKRPGELVLTVQLRRFTSSAQGHTTGEDEIASCLLRTNAVASEEEVTPGGHCLVSVPLESAPEPDETLTRVSAETVRSKLDRVRPPRVHIEYDAEAAGAPETPSQSEPPQAPEPDETVTRASAETRRPSSLHEPPPAPASPGEFREVFEPGAPAPPAPAPRPQRSSPAATPAPPRGEDTGAFPPPTLSVPAPVTVTPPRKARRAPFHYIGVAAAVALFATVGSLVYLRQGTKPVSQAAPERPTIAASPSGSAVRIVPAAPERSTIAASQSGSAVRIVPAAPERPTIAARLGQLQFSTDPPGADVLIDGKLVGLSPVTVALASGVHRYQVALKRHKTEEGTVEIFAGARVQKTLQLEFAE